MDNIEQIDLASTVLTMIRKKLDNVRDVDIKISRASKRNNRMAYVSLTPIGVKPGDKIVVVVAEDTMIVTRWKGNEN